MSEKSLLPNLMRPARAAELCVVASLLALPAFAATIAPPMLDITRQCDANSRHNATAMSECVVAESEARAELLQKWDKLSDASAGKCIKIGKKARKQPYTAMARCLSSEPVEVRAPTNPVPGPAPVPAAGPAPVGAPAAAAAPAPASAPSKFPYFSIPHFGVP